jgi:hypothetical protein
MAQDWGTFHVNQDGQDGGRRDREVRALRCQMLESFVFYGAAASGLPYVHMDRRFYLFLPLEQ